VIVDTSVLIAILRSESDANHLRDVLGRADRILMAAGTYLEARMVAERERGSAVELESLVAGLNIEIVHTDPKQLDFAFEGFRRFGKGRHPAALNFGDLFAYGLARALNEPLLFKGTDFGQTDVRIA
jgi:ribonuclease VapC